MDGVAGGDLGGIADGLTFVGLHHGVAALQRPQGERDLAWERRCWISF